MYGKENTKRNASKKCLVQHVASYNIPSAERNRHIQLKECELKKINEVKRLSIYFR